MKTEQELVNDVLSCANRVAGTSMCIPPEEDITLEAFHFDSLGLFAFILELEQTCGIEFDDAFINHERLRSIRSVAALVASRFDPDQAGSTTRQDTDSLPHV